MVALATSQSSAWVREKMQIQELRSVMARAWEKMTVPELHSAAGPLLRVTSPLVGRHRCRGSVLHHGVMSGRQKRLLVYFGRIPSGLFMAREAVIMPCCADRNPLIQAV